MALHDLTTKNKPPSNLKLLLGLNLKFIPRRRFTTTDLTDTNKRFKQQVFLQDYYLNNPPDSSNEDTSTFNSKLHIPTHWTPSPWKITPSVVTHTDNFLQEVGSLFRQKQCTPNLSFSQLHLLKYLRKKQDFVVVKADKNLGPCILESDQYIQYALTDHLNCRNTYKKLSLDSATKHMEIVHKKIRSFLYKHRKNLPSNDLKYIRRKTKECTDYFPKLYLLMKVHKKPLKTRPVVSCSGSLLHPLGVWLDTALQPITTTLTSFIASSYDLKEALAMMPGLPPGAQLFTADAVSMYTNIDTTYALRSIENFLHSQTQYKHLPIPAILDALELIMTNNVFQFGDCYFHQKSGTAMGTPPACCYATIYYAIHENFLFQKYTNNIFFYRRYIDDIFGVWVPSNSGPTFDDFKKDLKFHKLRWEAEEPSNSVVFLDMVLSISNNRIVTQLYEKMLNLYLYINPFSAHSPGVLSGLIIGNILRIHHLCSDPAVRRDFYTKFFYRLRARGYLPSQLLPLFHRGFKIALKKPMPSTKNKRNRLLQHRLETLRKNTPNDTAIFHIPYHPKDPSSREIQRKFRDVFLNGTTDVAGINRLIVAYSRPNNLGEMLSYRRIDSFNCPPVSSNFQTRDPWAGFFRS